MPGGSSGEISYPSYMQATHRNFLYGYPLTPYDGMDNNIVDLVNISHTDAGNPYNGETSFDPNAAIVFVDGSPLDKINDQFDAMSTIIASMNTAGYFDDFADIDILDDLSTELDNVVTAIDTVLASSTITDLVTAFEDNKKPRFLRDISVWTAGMADINAVNTSSFVLGMGLRQDEFSKSVDAFEADLKSKLYNTIMGEAISSHLKASILRVATKDNLYANGPAIYNQLTQLKAEIEKLILISMNEKKENQLRLDVDEALWDYEVYMYAGNLLASIAGAAAGRKGPTKAETAMGGALTGASIGASLPGPAAIPGMIGGALIGYIMGSQ